MLHFNLLPSHLSQLDRVSSDVMGGIFISFCFLDRTFDINWVINIHDLL
ncbi:hypothetical protein JCM19239_2084 [Vibrio variabilis]|uniref:Uncharacterized protein n=1 Tax=Vibrio variabilis TaxID=990271 RepID=A0ABQ0JES9_9VIBR|nr:hypothetical protein JCM19239_2084 [Vibrio variabilis]